MEVRKTDGTFEEFSKEKLTKIIKGVYRSAKISVDKETIKDIIDSLYVYEGILCSSIRKQLEHRFEETDERLYNAYVRVKKEKDVNESLVQRKKDFILKYKKANNNADATIDDNSNVANKNIGVLNAEIHKPENIETSRQMIMDKLKEIYPNFPRKQYVRDLESHIIYKHDESSFCGPIAPYCVSITMYPFLTNGIKGLGGLSAAPKNIDSFCGMYTNLVFSISAMYAGAVATSEFLLYFTYFAKKEYGNDFYLHPDRIVTKDTQRPQTILNQLHQYWQHVAYTINQPMGARGLQSAFTNFSYFDKPFFEGMFGDFYFPDGTKPDWESLCWIQKEFMKWFNEERTKTMLTFPVESFTLLYKDGKFQDEDSFNFVCEEYARGHSFFTYISDTVDSLSSCCRLKNKIQTKEFNFTNGNIGIQTGSKSVITLNLNRIVQDWFNNESQKKEDFKFSSQSYPSLQRYIGRILGRVYKYHTAYNEWLWDMYDANLLPAYLSGFIDLNKQYMTIGLNGLNQAAEFLGMECSDNDQYAEFCQKIFSYIKEQNEEHKVTEGHKLTFNTEMVPAESLAIKNYNWDKADGYWVPDDTNLYASYIFKPNDKNRSVIEKIRMHGSRYIGDYLDGGSAAHINLDTHLSVAQYKHLLTVAAKEGCSYITWNIPNSQCEACGYISKVPLKKCPRCGSTNISLWDRIIGYLTKVKNWSAGRQIEQKTRVYSDFNKEEDA